MVSHFRKRDREEEKKESQIKIDKLINLNILYRYNTYQSPDPKWPMNKVALSKSQVSLHHNDEHENRVYFNYLHDWRTSSRPLESIHILEHLFVNTDGFAMYLDPGQPLFMVRREQEQRMCFSVNNTGPYESRSMFTTNMNITWHVFVSSNIRKVLDYVIQHSGLMPTRLNSKKDWAIPSNFFLPYWRLGSFIGKEISSISEEANDFIYNLYTKNLFYGKL